jgi:polar amino acid transport system substrate-binding protein
MRGVRGRVLTAACAALAALTAVAGCSGGMAGGTSAAADSLLRQIQQRGVLRVADCLSFAPFGFYNKSGQPEGYDVDIAKEMATDLGVKLKMVDTTSDDRIPNLQTGKVDVVICNFTENTERAKQIAFTDPYVVAGETLLVKKSSGIRGISGLSGKTVATVKGSTDSQLVSQLNPRAKVQEYDTSAAAVLAVKQGQSDAMIEDSNFQAYQAKINPDLTVTHDSLVPLEYNGFGVKQGDQVWLNWLNQFLFQLNTSGQNATLYKKWFGVAPRYPLRPSY